MHQLNVIIHPDGYLQKGVEILQFVDNGGAYDDVIKEQQTMLEYSPVTAQRRLARNAYTARAVLLWRDLQ